MAQVIGIIADTHGLLRPEAVQALAGCVHIIHAGDVGGENILAELAKLAPVTTVRGNVDREAWARRLPDEARITIAGVRFFVLHDRNALQIDPASGAIDVVISGHSHQPLIERVKGVLYINPGSAGRRRFSLPVTLAKLEISGTDKAACLVHLLPDKIR